MSRVLIVIDMQNDFVTGSLGSKEAQAIVPNVKKKIIEYADRGDRVIFTRDTHEENYLDTPEGKKLPVKHCINGTAGWQIVPGLEIENYEKALNTIKEQLEDMKNGNFTQVDIQNAKNLIVESVKSISAEQDTQISYYYGQELSDKFTTIDEYAKKIEEQTKEQVVELAKNIEINTIYFLRD